MRKVYHFLNKVSDRIQAVIEFIAALCIITGLAAVFFQVIYRYIIVKFASFSFPFTEEYARFTTVWVTYLCAGVCLKEGFMVSLNLLYDALPRKPKMALYFLTRLLMALFLYWVIFYTIAYLPRAVMYTSPVLRLSGIYLYSMPIIGSVFLLFEMIVEAIGVACGELPPFVSRNSDELQDKQNGQGEPASPAGPDYGNGMEGGKLS